MAITIPSEWHFTIDDAVFAPFAEATAQPLLTTDLRLARAARQHARVEVLMHLDPSLP